MTLRLLPWTGPDGKPCYLSTDDKDSFLSRLADHIEAEQLAVAEDLLDHIHRAPPPDAAPADFAGPADPADPAGPADPAELRLMIGHLTEALADALRAARSRATRSPAPPSATAEPPCAEAAIAYRAGRHPMRRLP